MEEDFLEQINRCDVDLVVCSDAEAILGIGDQGVGVNPLYSSPDILPDQIALSRVLGYSIPHPFGAQISPDYFTARSQLRNPRFTRE